MRSEHFRGGFEDRSGKINEAMLLGEVRKTSPEYAKTLKSLGGDERGYLPFPLAMELAMMFQPLVKVANKWNKQEELKPQDPTNPNKLILKDLRIAIADALGFESDEDLERIKYYTAVGSPLDFFHGVDAFIVLEGKNPGDLRTIVTFDATLRTEASAKEKAKADIILKIRDLEAVEDGSAQYHQLMANLANQAASVLKNPKHR